MSEPRSCAARLTLHMRGACSTGRHGRGHSADAGDGWWWWCRRDKGSRAERGGGGGSILRHGQVSLQLHTLRGAPAATLLTSPHRVATTRCDSLAAANRRWCRPDVVSLTGSAHLCDWRTVEGWTYAGPFCARGVRTYRHTCCWSVAGLARCQLSRLSSTPRPQLVPAALLPTSPP